MMTVHRHEPYRLFLVEDNLAEVRLIQEAINEANLSELVELEYAFDGEEASEMLDENKTSAKKFDMVLLDLNMPKVSGKEVLSKIKTDEELNALPVIVLTNSDYKKDMIDCYKLGADGFMQKPADFKKLVDFFVSIKRSIEVRNKLSIYFIEKEYYNEMKEAV